jgi:hypothetical protein
MDGSFRSVSDPRGTAAMDLVIVDETFGSRSG